MTTVTNPELPKSYAPAHAEGSVREQWDRTGVFHAEPGGEEESYCILIPPPNVTAALHLGHALNNTLQDVLIRYHRMRGFNTLWMPGTDHAGIATQSVVEKRLIREKKRRTDFSREQFVGLVQEWKDEYEATITEQLKAMGCSCDWERQRFTMDPMCADAVRAAFFRLFGEDLIYRGKRLVNWDPVTQTALADDEVEMQDVEGHMWYLRYPLEPEGDADASTEHVVVATTRPETMLGDTAVAVNPRDPRAATLRGRRVRLPIVDRVVPIVEDDYVVMPGADDDPKAEFATGFLKVTPGHDPNDWEIGLRHDLPVINMLGPDGTVQAGEGWDDVTAEASAFIGQTREEAREAVVQWFRDRDLLEDIRPYGHSVGHSYRSHVPIEPYLSDQWYVRVTDERMGGEALRAIRRDQYDGQPPARERGPATRQGDDGLSFFPPRYARTYQTWHENLRDWCISRQLWWGHRIPVWSLDEVTEPVAARWEAIASQHADRVVARRDEQRMHLCFRDENDELVAQTEAEGFAQDPDVLDTWFSSALWPLSTMGWPTPDATTKGLLETFNPSSVLCTARDIITLWVSRMVMFNRFFRDGVLPYRHVYIHPMIQDGHGQRMSKSLGNGVDPRDIIHSHGADAMRFTLCRMATTTQDVRLPVDMICPGCEHAFHPKEATSPAGYRVADPRQECPSCKVKMVSGYGAASGAATPDDASPLARNTSSKFDEGRNFANKLWNATRFALRSLPATDVASDEPTMSELTLVDRWIVSRLHQTLHVVEDALSSYQFNVYADAMYQFVWGDFCDWYLEAVKPTITESRTQQQVLLTTLDAIMRLLHPICPFVTETLWPHVEQRGSAGLDGVALPRGEVLATAAWPDIACRIHDQDAIDGFARVRAVVEAVRTVRGNTRQPLRLLVPRELLPLVRDASPVVETLAGLEAVETIADDADRPADAVPVPFEGRELLLLGLAEHVDRDAERERLGKIVAEKEAAVRGFKGRLDNPKYVGNAPPAVVQETRDRLEQAETDLAAARRALEAL